MSDTDETAGQREDASGAEPLVARPVYLEDRRDTISLLQLVNVGLRHRKRVVGLSLLAAFLVVTVTLILPRQYTVSASFTSESRQQPQISQLSGLASQFGFNLPAVSGGQSPSFYADLITSREVLQAVVSTDYEVEDEELEGTADLVEIFDIEGDTRAERVEQTVELLRERMTAGTDVETGVVSFSVTTRWPDLSEAIGHRIVELVNEFNLERRQSQAAAERQFLEGRVEHARRDLLAAEDSLERFLERNRSYQNSPRLRFEHDRLQRRVSLQQQVYSSLVQSYEQAKIEEVRNTPVVTVVTPPERPARPDRRRLVLKAAAGLVAGGLLALLWIAWSEFLGGAAERDPETYRQFRRLVSGTKEELRRIWRRIRGRMDRSDDGG